MKRILCATTNDHVAWGGSEELWLSCALEALGLGLEVAICTLWDPLPPKLSTLGTYSNLTFLSKRAGSSSLCTQINRFLPRRFKINFEKYKKDILTWNPDLILISQGNNADGLDLIQFCIKHKIKYCTISQAVYEGIWPDTTKSNEMRIGFTAAIANYFVSKANLRVTELQIGNSLKNARVIRNPFNVPYHNDLPYPGVKTYKLACVARYEFYAKGQDVLLDVLSQDKWKSRNIEVTLYGNGPNEESLHRLIAYFNLKNVHVGGHKKTLEIWKENHALVLPSRFEGLPLALVEAMLCGRFGIVTDVSGNSEAFIHEESGFLAQAPKAEYFDRAMEQAWLRRTEWEEIGKKAKQHIKTLVPENPGKELLQTIFKDLANSSDQ